MNEAPRRVDPETERQAFLRLGHIYADVARRLDAERQASERRERDEM